MGAAFNGSDRLRAKLLLALAIGAVANGPALSNAPVYDDELLIFSNRLAHDTSHLVDNLTRDFFYASAGPDHAIGYYRPFVKLAFMLQLQLFGTSVLGYHVLSIVLWLGVIAFGALLARQLGMTSIAIGFGAALYASHPVSASAVGTITSQSDLLVALGMLASAVAYLRHRELGTSVWLFAALLAETFALGCKETAALTPVLLAAAELSCASVLLSRRGLRVAWLSTLVPVGLYVGLRAWLHVLPVHEERTGGALAAFVTAAKVLCSASARAVAPTIWLPLVHPLRPAATWLVLAAWGLPAIALLAGSLVLFARRAELRVWIVLFLAPLAPLVLGESMIHTTDDASRITISDRWLLLPALVASYAVAALLIRVRGRLDPPLQAALTLGVALLVVAQTLITREEVASYASENARVLHLADLYIEHGVNEPFAREAIAAAQAVAAEAKGDVVGAVRAYADVVALKPEDLMRHYNLAVALMRQPDLVRARDEAYLAYHGRSHDGRVQLSPNDSWSRRRPERAFLLAVLSEELGDRVAAARYYDACLALRPDFSSARDGRARVR